MDNSSTIIGAVESVTRKWTRQRKAEERARRAPASRRYTLTRTRRTTIRDAAFEVMEPAYMKASANGRYPALARQIMYAARPEILRMTGEPDLDSQYFTQTLLPEYMEMHACNGWDVAYDARGHLHEPHTKKQVALGTLEVRDYLGKLSKGNSTDDGPASDFNDTDRYPTHGPVNRYGAVLFIEKEGFLPLFRAAKLAERYDIAIMSTKGLSVTAARLLVDEVCGGLDVPLLVLHDFDKAGFSILGTLKRNTRRYCFQHGVDVIDLGLRLADVQEHDLETESVSHRSNPSRNLRTNGATDEEIEFLCGNGRHGQRVELNAFTSDELVEWIQMKLDEHGIKKVVPDREVIESAYRRAMEIAIVRGQLDEIEEAAYEKVQEAELPETLVTQIEKRLEDSPGTAWDQVVVDLAASQVDEEE